MADNEVLETQDDDLDGIDFTEQVNDEDQTEQGEEEVTEEVEEAQESESESESGHQVDKAVQKLQQDVSTIMRGLESLKEAKEKPAATPPPQEPTSTPLDEILSKKADDIDPYEAPKILANEVIRLNKQLKEIEAGSTAHTKDYGDQIAAMQEQVREAQFSSQHPDLKDKYGAIQEKAYQYVNNFVDPSEQGSIPTGTWNKIAKNAMDLAIADFQEQVSNELSKSSPKPTKGASISKPGSSKRSAKEEIDPLDEDNLEDGFFYEHES